MTAFYARRSAGSPLLVAFVLGPCFCLVLALADLRMFDNFLMFSCTSSPVSNMGLKEPEAIVGVGLVCSEELTSNDEFNGL